MPLNLFEYGKGDIFLEKEGLLLKLWFCLVVLTWSILENFKFQESSYQHLLINKKKTVPLKADLTNRLIKFYQPRLEVELLV